MDVRIVLCCFLNRNYLAEARTCIESIREVGKFEGRITLITDFTDVEIDGVDVHRVPSVDRVEMAAGCRLRMLEVLSWEPTDIFLYLDTDILCVQNMQSFLDHASTMDDRLHVYGLDELGLTQIKHPAPRFYASSLTSDPRIRNQPAWSSGVLLFRPTPTIQQAFCRTYAAYTEYLSQDPPPKSDSWEQKFLCYTFCDMEWYVISLNPFVYEENSVRNTRFAKPLSDPDRATFNHFCGVRNQARSKLMREMLNNRLKA